MPKFSCLRTPLQPLFRNNTNLVWLQSHTNGRDKITCAISEDCLLQFYDVSHPILMECDASKKGLDCVLLQPMDNSITNYDISNFSNKEMEEFLQHLRLVAYSSKSLSDAKTHYANIEHELLGVVFRIEHFKHFTLGRKTHINTNHKPLIPLFSEIDQKYNT